MAEAEIGVIGLGVMGANLALNIADNGYHVAVYNRTAARTDEFAASAGELSDRVTACATLEDFVAAIRPPRPVIIMVKAGEPVDQQIAALKPLLEANDIIIDAGNANFRDTMRRFTDLEGSGLTFIGMGVSGGEEGARRGPSIMVGGAEEAWRRVEPVLTAISAKYQGEPCAAWLGENGAGHFVKTIHNGIEYADMQMIAEVYGVMRDHLSLDAASIGSVFSAWSKGPLDSYLIDITAEVLKVQDAASGRPIVDIIVDAAGQKGTGRWSVIESQMMGVPATAIEAAVAARSLSAMREQRATAQGRFGIPAQQDRRDQQQIVDDLEKALLAGKVAAYAQGFAVMAAASQEFGWNLPMATIARIWRAGCIIRSTFLDEIATAFTQDPDVANLALTPAFSKIIEDTDQSLRRVVAEAALNGLPVPALASALGYFDTYRRERGTANLIQAQRDFFGAHGFARLDAEGEHHGPWGG
ncbi:MAG: phosphogluconate dehydrogenase (NADP(+)-dependent, decarboxylating) [Hoeflea sp.]|uniref:NADP-dependent phosphogluconate dehydrogenase n=1 Tax=Hoeflea sp. TaxID=1940281 RepID=UPI000C0C6A1D|nr:NADP-dependent phosphogluconate dehydrogenase [Hoeflea sp.]PHR20118.1 MAG: phosphogluconate dehydrogenase (NADP(+)-dependent, decarboxylating) [Hoeflea sp.]